MTRARRRSLHLPPHPVRIVTLGDVVLQQYLKLFGHGVIADLLTATTEIKDVLVVRVVCECL
jgi:hypothetical protein